MTFVFGSIFLVAPDILGFLVFFYNTNRIDNSVQSGCLAMMLAVWADVNTESRCFDHFLNFPATAIVHISFMPVRSVQCVAMG